MIGRHLKALPGRASKNGFNLVITGLRRQLHPTRQDELFVSGIRSQRFNAATNKLIDIAVIIGQQNPGLHGSPIGTCVMHQPPKREIYPHRIKQGQRPWAFFVIIPKTVGYFIANFR